VAVTFQRPTGEAVVDLTHDRHAGIHLDIADVIADLVRLDAVETPGREP